MSFIISCIDEKIEVDINNENVQKSKLLIEFYEECKEGSELSIPFNNHLVNYFIKENIKFDGVNFEIMYNFLNYLIVNNEVMVEYLSYKLYKIDFEDAKYYIENVIDKSFLKTLEQKKDIIKCAEKNDLVGVFIAIKSGADINVGNKWGWNALHIASRDGHTETVKLLLESGADVNAKDGANITALHHASFKSYIKIVKVLLESGADVNIKDTWGMTALQYASREGHIETVELLLESAAGVNMRDEDGYTALHFASWNGHVEIVKLLKQYT